MAVDKATYGIKQNNSSKTAIDIAKQYGLTLTSGYRSPSKNASIGGSKTSFHQRGYAYDFAGTPSQMQKFAEWAKTSGLYSEVIYNNGDHADHVHVGWGEKTPYYDVKNSSSSGKFNGVGAVSTEGTTGETSSSGFGFGSMLGGIIRVSSIIIIIIFAFVFFMMAFPNTQQVLKTGGKLLK
jgi:Peptidase M15